MKRLFLFLIITSLIFSGVTLTFSPSAFGHADEEGGEAKNDYLEVFVRNMGNSKDAKNFFPSVWRACFVDFEHFTHSHWEDFPYCSDWKRYSGMGFVNQIIFAAPSHQDEAGTPECSPATPFADIIVDYEGANSFYKNTGENIPFEIDRTKTDIVSADDGISQQRIRGWDVKGLITHFAPLSDNIGPPAKLCDFAPSKPLTYWDLFELEFITLEETDVPDPPPEETGDEEKDDAWPKYERETVRKFDRDAHDLPDIKIEVVSPKTTVGGTFDINMDIPPSYTLTEPNVLVHKVTGPIEDVDGKWPDFRKHSVLNKWYAKDTWSCTGVGHGVIKLELSVGMKFPDYVVYVECVEKNVECIGEDLGPPSPPKEEQDEEKEECVKTSDTEEGIWYDPENFEDPKTPEVDGFGRDFRDDKKENNLYRNLSSYSTIVLSNFVNCEEDCQNNEISQNELKQIIADKAHGVEGFYFYGKNAKYASEKFLTLALDVKNYSPDESIFAVSFTENAIRYATTLVENLKDKKLYDEQFENLYSISMMEFENANYESAILNVSQIAEQALPLLFPQMQENIPYSIYQINVNDSFGNPIKHFEQSLQWGKLEIKTITGIDGKALVVGPPGAFAINYFSEKYDKHNGPSKILGLEGEITEIGLTVRDALTPSKDKFVLLESNKEVYSYAEAISLRILTENWQDAKLISLTLIDSNEEVKFVRTIEPKSNISYFDFRIPNQSGTYSVIATSLINEEHHSDILSFDVLGDSLPEIKLPGWIKNNAGWWADGVSTDSEFANAIGYLVYQGIIDIKTEVKEKFVATNLVIPEWIKNNARWWSENKISDSEFTKSFEYLFNEELIKVESERNPESLDLFNRLDSKIPQWRESSEGFMDGNKFGMYSNVNSNSYSDKGEYSPTKDETFSVIVTSTVDIANFDYTVYKDNTHRVVVWDVDYFFGVVSLIKEETLMENNVKTVIKYDFVCNTVLWRICLGRMLY